MTKSNRFLAVIFLLVVCFATFVLATMTTYTVNILVDGETVFVKTAEDDINVILQQAGVTLGEKDLLDTSEFEVGAKAKNGNQILIRRAVPVTIVDDGKVAAELLLAGTVDDALKEADIECREVDRMNYEGTALLEKGMKIEIQRAFSVDVVADGETKTSTLLEGTVADLLAEQGIVLGADDEVKPSLKTTLKPGLKVHVYRVKYEEREETEVIKFKTVTKSSSTIYKGETKVDTKGQNGEKIVTYQDKIVDGKLEKTITLKEKVTKKAVNKVVLKGTKIKVAPKPVVIDDDCDTDNNKIPTNAIAVFEGKGVAYTAKAGAKTASGRPAKVGNVAVDPKVIPYGTEMYVISSNGKYVYGYCTAADCGNFKYTDESSIIVDVFFNTESECQQWGKKTVTVYILKWGKGK